MMIENRHRNILISFFELLYTISCAPRFLKLSIITT